MSKPAARRRPRPFRIEYRAGKVAWTTHAASLRGAARAAFPRLLQGSALVAKIYDQDDSLLVALLRRKRTPAQPEGSIWVGIHVSVEPYFME